MPGKRQTGKEQKKRKATQNEPESQGWSLFLTQIIHYAGIRQTGKEQKETLLTIGHVACTLVVLVFVIYVAHKVYDYIFSKKPNIIISETEWNNQELIITGRALDKGVPVEKGVIEFVLTQKSKNDGKETLHQTYRSASLSNSTGQSSGYVRVSFPGVSKDSVMSVMGKLYMSPGEGLAAERDFHFEKQKLETFKGRSVFSWVGIISIALVPITILTFTGDLTRGKFHFLMILMYVVTFLSIVAPSSIALLLHYNENLQVSMQKSLIGLVLGKTSKDADPQWLLNIGGIMKRPAEGNDAQGGNRKYPLIEGGVVVPFYIIWLAMAGAGINMTRRVPDFQRQYAEKLPSRPKDEEREAVFKRCLRGLDPFSGEFVQNEKEAAKIRGRLIRNYMYLLSAPFLGIAVYYLLQVLGSEVKFPAMVVMAFFTGLKSDTIIKAIARLGDSFLKVEKMEEEERESKEKEVK